jgi:acetyl esterase/lipase
MKKAVFLAFLLALGALLPVQGPLQAQEQKPASPPVQALRLNAETFANTPFLQRPRLSPSGTYLAGLSSVDNQQSLLIVPVYNNSGANSTPELSRISLDGSKFDLDWWQWVNDDYLIAGISANDSVEGDKIRFTRMIAIERASSKIIVLGKRNGGQHSSLLWKARDGSPRILMQVQNSIYTDEGFWPEVQEVDVSTGKSSRILSGRAGIIDYYADANGVVRLGEGYDPQTRIARTIYRANANEAFRLLERANLARNQSLTKPVWIDPASDRAIAFSKKDGFSAVYALNIGNMALGAKMFGVAGYDVDDVRMDIPNGVPLGYYVTEKRDVIHWVDPELKELQALFDKSVGAGNAMITSMSADQRRLLVKVGGPDQPGAYFFFDRDGKGVLSRIAFVDEKLKMAKLAPVTTIEYKARDGMVIPAILTLPKDKPAKNLPFILLPHGGPHVRDSETWDWWVQFLAAKGYGVIQPNYRGSTGYGAAHFESGKGEWGNKMQDDLNDAISHLASIGMADPKRVCIAGASYGGYAAMRAAQRDGSLYRCAISYAGVSDLAALARYDRSFLYGKEFVDDLKEKAPKFDQVSPLRFPNEFSAPILIMHGKNDLRVPVEQSRRMADKLKSAGKPHRYIEQPLGDHHFSRYEDRLQFLKEMEAFLDTHNPAS